MAIALGSHHTITPDTNAGSPLTEDFDLGDTTTAIVICITIYDTSSSDGVVSAVSFAGDGATSSTVEYDATCDGHMSIWYLNSPNTAASSTLSITHGGTVTDITGSITEITGGEIAEHSVATKSAGNGSPTIEWTAEDAFMFACMLDDQADAGKIAVDAPGVQIFETDVGDVVGAQVRTVTTSDSYTLSWTDDDADEDYIVAGAAYDEAPTLTQVYKDMQAKWDTRELVSKDMQVKFDIRELVYKDLQALWDIFDSVYKDLQAKWDIRELVYKDLQAIWDMSGAVYKDLQAKWDILNLVNKNLQGKYDILNLVNKSLEVKWDIRVLVNKSLQAVWDISASAKDRAIASYRLFKKIRLGF